MAKLPPASSSAASASSSGHQTVADGGCQVEDSVCVARRLRASTLAQRPRSQCHLSQLSVIIGGASADAAGPSSGNSTAAAAARKRRSSAPTGCLASSAADPAAVERAPKRARRGTSSSVGRRSATTALSAEENQHPQSSASRAGANRRRGVDGSASGSAASQLRASHSQRRGVEQAAPFGETSASSGGPVNRRRRGRAPGRPRSTIQTRTPGGPPPPPALSTRHQLLHQLPAAASDSSTAPAATTGSCASSSHSGRRGGGRAGGKLATLDSSAAAAGAGSSLAATADGRSSAAAASTSAAAVGGAAAASSATGEQQPVAGAAGAGSGAALLDAAAAAAAGGEEEGDMGRLQALLEARGIPPHLLGALGPRMQQMLHRSMGSSSKIQQLVAGLQATGDETQQLQAAIEMGQLLVMGNEETLAGFPIKQVVPPLVILLQMEHNFDMMNHACRALTYLMEALPRSTAAVVEAVPALLQKLQSIQCMDVAEQALSALELISRRHSKNILQVGGISSCLMYVDFFSITAQRAALAITSNCCLALSQDEFQLVQTNLPALSQRLTHQDKKTVESVCIAFSRLVDTFKSDPSKVKEIAGNGLLYNVQQLLISSPPIISSSTFCEVTKMLRLMCSHCPELGAQLLTENIAETLCVLLVSNKDQMELVSRNPEELYALMCLVGELLPSLPTDGLFTIDQWLLKAHPRDVVHWQWRDDRGTWNNYSQADSFSIESASQSGADEAQLLFMGRHYSIDLNNMRQINESTGTSRPVLRRTGSSTAAPTAASGPSSAAPAAVVSPVDPRLATLQANSQLYEQLVRSLFSVLYKVYSSCAGPAVRHTSLRAILRMVYFASPDMLKELVSIQDMSSHLTGMLSSGDLKIVVAALQLAEVLIQKLPEQCDLHFRREGVVYQINQLSRGDPTTTSGSTSSASASGSSYSTLSTPSSSSAIDGSVGSGRRAPELCAAGPSTASLPAYLDTAAPQQAHGMTRHQYPLPVPVPSTSAVNSTMDPAADAPANLSLSDVLKRKRTSKRAGNPSRRCRQEEASAAATAASASSSSVPASMAYSALETLSRGSGSSRTAGASGGAFSSQFRAGKSSTPSAAASSAAASSSSAPTTGGGSSSASRFQASFLASLNPARWGRTGGSTSAGRGGAGSSALVGSSGGASGQSGSLLNRTASGASLAGQRERVRAWIRQRARQFIRQYFSGDTSGRTPAIARLDAALKQLRTQPKQPLLPLTEISAVVCQSDISPFEVLQSGLVAGLTDFLTAEQYSCPAAAPTAAAAAASPRADRLRAFLHVFAGCSCLEGLDGPPPPQPLPQQTAPLSALVAKLQACLSQAEQLLVKVHDVAEATGGVSGQSALRYFNQNQLKCNLYRWPDCSSLRQWRGGPVKIDPLALVQAIERYLVIRGYGRVRDEDDDASDDADSEEDIDDTMQAAVSISQGSNHRLQFVINGHVLPYNMTVFQAIQQYSRDPAGMGSLDPDSEHTVGSAHLFQRTHTIYYRPAPDDDNSASSSSGLSVGRSSSSTSSSSHHTAASTAGGANKRSKAGGSSGASTKSAGGSGGTGKRRDELWSDGVVPEPVCPLQALLTPALPNPPVTICDPCLPTLNLLRVLNALSRFHGQLYQMPRYTPLIPPQEFINHKVAAKANRQLQDPVIIMTGNSPQWLHQIGITCPFLLPFDTRQLLFHSCTFDRDRALLRLIDASPELQTADGDDRIAPKLERKKRSVARDDLLRQAETLMSELAGSRAMLEVQYDGEVGSGLGPTLEFYSQVSRELQRADLGLWRGERSRHALPPQIAALTGDHKPAAVVGADGFSGGSSSDVETAGDALSENSRDDAAGPEYVVSPLGLYPIPLGRSCKSANLSRIKAKYRFLGKLMAKALMDSRLLDLPLSAPFYRWLLRQERCLSGADLAQLDPTLAQSLAQLQLVVRRRRSVELSPAVSVQARADAIEALTVDGCSITDLGLEFTLPGHPAIELKRSGKDQPVTVHNLEQYLKLLTHWLLYESVYRQMEAFREGFESVFPIDNLAMFQPDEMDFLFCGSQESCWDVQTLRDAFRPDHGYTHESPAVRNLISILAEFSYEERRCFLSFVTGSPRLPVGGFRSLTPPLTIVRKIVTAPENADDLLPSVMTCVNYLKLPDYSSRQLMRRRLITAVRDGRLSFMLS